MPAKRRRALGYVALLVVGSVSAWQFSDMARFSTAANVTPADSRTTAMETRSTRVASPSSKLGTASVAEAGGRDLDLAVPAEYALEAPSASPRTSSELLEDGVAALDRGANAAVAGRQVRAADVVIDAPLASGEASGDVAVRARVVRPRGGFRSLRQSPDPAPSPSYQDRLINPDGPRSDPWIDTDARRRRPWDRLDQHLELAALYRDDEAFFADALDLGLQYVASLDTGNWGRLQLRLVALDEFDEFSGPETAGNGLFTQKQGLSRWSLEQSGLPLSGQWSLDSVVGMHRQRPAPMARRGSLISYRFSAAEPDVLGASTQLNGPAFSLGLATGRLGQSRGTLLPGFVETQGRMQRLSLTRRNQDRAMTLDAWQTNGQTLVENRTGFRLSVDQRLNAKTDVSLTAVDSGGQRALLLGGVMDQGSATHDFGAYYFENDLLWLDTRIGDDNAGAFYRFNQRRGGRTLGMSMEFRRDGLAGDQVLPSDNAFINLSYAARLSRRSHWNHVLSLRERRTEGGGNDVSEQNLRSYFTRQHDGGGRSSISLLSRRRDDGWEFQTSYGWFRELGAADSVELSTWHTGRYGGVIDGDEFMFGANWRHDFARGGSLSLGAGYALGRSRLDENQGFQGNLSLDYPFSRAFSASLQLDYSRDRTDYLGEDRRNLAGEFFTGSTFDEDDLLQSRSFTAMFRLRYDLEGRAAQRTLNPRRGTRGAGRVRGVLFIDTNGDGVQQPSEDGLAGVTLYLDSVHPTVTDAAGGFEFPQVGLGQHYMFVDAQALPLPWLLTGGEFTPIDVRLRRTTEVAIPVRSIALADSDRAEPG
ncbi:MAG: hypothetical protein AAF918_11980 [Pseudomonadota bacterium]